MVSQTKKECSESNGQFLLPVKQYPVGYPLKNDAGYASDDPESLVDYNACAARKKKKETLLNWAFALGFGLGAFSLLCYTECISMNVNSGEFPVLRIDDLYVCEFNPPTPGISTAQWEMNVTVKNPNSGLRVFFRKLEGFLYYKEDDLFSDLVASTVSQPSMTMETNTRTIMQVKLQANDTEIAMLDGSIMDKMGKDKNNGTVHFSLHFKLLTTFDNQQRWPWKRHDTRYVKIYCNDVKVGFDDTTGNGYAVSRDIRNGPLICRSDYY